MRRSRDGSFEGVSGCRRHPDGSLTPDKPYMVGTVAARAAEPGPFVLTKVEVPVFSGMVGVYPDLRSVIGVPLREGSETVAVLVVFTRIAGRDLGETELRVVVDRLVRAGFDVAAP
jgi:hypothetical protein